jgi:hypothetical protein
MKEKKTVKKPSLPVYLLGITWVLYAVFFPLYRFYHYIIAALLSLAVYFVVSLMLPDETVTTVVFDPAVDDKEAAAKIVAEAKENLEALHKSREGVLDSHIAASITRMEEITLQIFDNVAKSPEKLPRVRRFVTYYLPTTLKLLESYKELDSQHYKGPNIRLSMSRIEGMLDDVVKAFERQLDALFRDEALDITADIAVLDSMLAKEGLTGDGIMGSLKSDRKDGQK